LQGHGSYRDPRATGAGKSFLGNFLITNLQKYDPYTFIFDLGGSFEHLTGV